MNVVAVPQPRRVAYVSGTRADFGLMRAALAAIHATPGLELGIIVTGMHLSPKFGATVADIEGAGLPIVGRVPVDLDASTALSTARSLGVMTTGIADALAAWRADVVLLLGDRGEMLAAVTAAVYLGLPAVHLHGGERSGTVDEPVRHAVSKLATFHLVATEESRGRLLRMGEADERIAVVGAPGLDDILAAPRPDRGSLCVARGLDPGRPVALAIYHPVQHLAGEGAAAVRDLVDACRARGLQVLALRPNSDEGSDDIRVVLDALAADPDTRVLTHLGRGEFVSWMAEAEVMVGNSSAGIIEAASFGTPVVNVGVRQRLRERNACVIDCGTSRASIDAALDAALQRGRLPPANVYGDGHTAARIAAFLRDLDASPSLLVKCNGY
jgi:GDP/UDP-N,N'-diacetylbacillosamine 2-epimerase (hydrolysing)